MNTEATPSKPPYKKIIKWTGIGIFSLLMIFSLLVIALYFVLKQGTLTNTAISKINPIANTFGVNISRLDSAKIDLLGDIAINGLSLEWLDEAAGKASVNAEQVRLQYSIGDLIANRLQVTQVLLSGINIDAELKTTTAVQPLPEESQPLDLKQLGELLSLPPMPIDIQAVTLENFKFKITLSNDTESQSINGSLEKLSTALVWNNEQLKLNTRLALNQQQKDLWHVTLVTAEKVTELDFLPVWLTDVSLALNNSNNVWQLPEFSITQDLALEQLNLQEKMQDKITTAVKTDSLTFNLKSAKAESASSQSSSTGLAAIFPVPLQTSIAYKLAPLTVNVDQGSELNVVTQVKQEMSLQLNNVIESVTPFALSADFKLEQLLEIPDVALQIPQQTVLMTGTKVQLSANGKSHISENQKIDLDTDFALQFSSERAAFSQDEIKPDSPAIKASLTPLVRLNGKINLPDINDVFMAVAKLDASVAVQLLEASMTGNGMNEAYQLKQQTLAVGLNYHDKQVEMQSVLALDNLKAPQLKKVVSLQNKLELATNIDLDQAKITLALDLDKQPLVNAKLVVNNPPNQLKLDHQITLNLPLQLMMLHDAADGLKLIGTTSTQLSGSTTVSHNANNIQAADTTSVEQWPVNTQGNIKLIQNKAPTAADGVTIKDYLAIAYVVAKDKVIKSNLSLMTPGVKVAPLLAAMPIELQNKTQATWPLSKTLTQGFIDIDNQQALKYDLVVDDKPEYLTLNGDIEASETPQWQKFLADLKAAEAVGALNIKLSPDIRLKHNAKSILEFDAEKLDAVVADIALNAEISQLPNLPGKDVVIAKPLKLKQTVAWSTKALNATTELNIAQLELPGLLKVENLPGNIQLKAENGLEPEKVDLNLHFDQGNIVFYQTTEKGVDSLTLSKLATPLSVNLNAEKHDQLATINKLHLNIGNGAVAVDATGNATLDGKNIVLDALIASTMQKALIPERGLTGAGSLTMPLKLTVNNGTQATLETSVAFDNYSLEIDQLKLDNLNGRLFINEELLLKDEFVGFKYLLKADPFQRVDFDRIQPYLNNENILSFARIEANGMKIGPGLTSISVDQNLVRISRMDMELFDGHIMGQMFFDAAPGAQRFGLLSRISQIDPRYLLPETSREKNSKVAPVSTRTAVTFDINERLMEGQIDVTQINKAQLLQILELVDPEHKDEQIAMVRSALRFAFPQRVSVDMASGLMNLEIAVSSLPAPLKLRGLPLTPIIQQSAGDIEAALGQLPLKKF